MKSSRVVVKILYALIFILGATAIALAVFWSTRMGESKEFQVRYNANGGWGEDVVQSTQDQSFVAYGGQEFELEGQQFLGWSTEPTDDLPQYYAGDKVVVSQNTTLYAIWSKPKIIVTYISAETSQTKNVETIKNRQFAVGGEAVFVRQGYTLIGWSISQGQAEATYAHGRMIVLTKNTTLYAVWHKDVEDITYHSNDGTNQTLTEVAQLEGGTLLGSDAFARTNYILVGWNTSPDGSGTFYEPNTQISNIDLQHTTLYADWCYHGLVFEDAGNNDWAVAWDGTADYTNQTVVIPAYYQGKVVSQLKDYNPGITSMDFDLRFAGYGSDAMSDLKMRGAFTLDLIDESGANSSKMTGIIIPSTITKIPAFAFASCTNLTNVELPSSVEEIGAQAFALCENLDNLTFNEGLKEIGAGAFMYVGLVDVELPSTVTHVHLLAFEIDNIDQVLHIPQNVEFWFMQNEGGNKSVIIIDSPTIAKTADNKSFNHNNILAGEYHPGFGFTHEIETEFGVEVIYERRYKAIYVKEGLAVGTAITNYFSEIPSNKAGYRLFGVMPAAEQVVTYNSNGGSGPDVISTKRTK